MKKTTKKDIFHSALSVQVGIEQPPIVNKSAIARFNKSNFKQNSASEYVEKIIQGDRAFLGKAITLIESTLEIHQTLAQEIVEKCVPLSGNSIRIGITGVPGVGKSTFIEAFGTYLTSLGHKVAVLAIDPSSERTKGSILGDKTRMEDLANDKNAFIRPSPSAGSLGGVARKTRESIILCEASGFDVIIVETVGVGQSETAVHSMVDFFLLLMLAGAGDELQGIKRGIMEMSDALVINKADGNNLNKAKAAKIEYQNALHLFPLGPSKWSPKTDICSAYLKTGMDKVWMIIQEYKELTTQNGYFESKRKDQEVMRMYETINQSLYDRFYKNQAVKNKLKKLEQLVASNSLSSYKAAQDILTLFSKDTSNSI